MSKLIDSIQNLVGIGDTVLDLCCGDCIITQHIKCGSMLGLDIHKPYLEKAKGRVDMLLNADVRFIGKLFLPRSFDVVIWLDGIEHLDSSEAIEALGGAEMVAKKMVIVLTPDKFITNDEVNPYQRHYSFFPESFWVGRGYTVQKFKNNTKDCPMVLAYKRIK